MPKIQFHDPTTKDHPIYLPKADLRTPVTLWGIFSCFPTPKPSLQMLEECKDVLLLTPDGQWNLYSDVYPRNEENTMDWEGNTAENKD